MPDKRELDSAGAWQNEPLQPMGQGKYAPQVALFRPALFEQEFTIPTGTSYSATMVVGPNTLTPLMFTLPDFYIGMAGNIVKGVIATDNKFCSGTFRLHLFRQPPVVLNDKQYFIRNYNDRKCWEGDIDFPGLAYCTGGTAAVTMALLAANDMPFPFYCSVTGSLYGILETQSAFVGVTGQRFYIGLETDLE